MARGRPRKNSDTPSSEDQSAPESQTTLERDLFLAADKLRKNLEPSDYKHVVLGLIFLRHISLASRPGMKRFCEMTRRRPKIVTNTPAQNRTWSAKAA